LELLRLAIKLKLLHLAPIPQIGTPFLRIITQGQGLPAAFLGKAGAARVGNPDLDGAQASCPELCAMLLHAHGA
jgi:hypothetical protein